ncbi:HAD-IA family hydrolase [Endozoicomonas sp. Mp262]|uniref:HAD family hydrolase n=1 Tax=Endozoicomonas sp. Mp262 TaxID=2919499 RepID=UPI0021DB76BB
MSKNQAIEGVFFDLDGTLMDTASDFISAVNQLQLEHNLPLLAADIIRKNVSAGSKTLTSLALGIAPDHPDIETCRQQLLAHYENHVNNSQRPSPATLYPGISSLLQDLEQRQIPWGIVTNKPLAFTTPLLRQAKLDNRSKSTVCPEHVKQPKPDPQALLLACQQASCLPERCVYIGDHKRDIDAGKQAGMTTIAALYGYIADDDNPEYWRADYQAPTASDIHQWLIRNHWKIPAA